MKWGAGYDAFVEINPSRVFFCDFLSIPDVEAQGSLRAEYVDLTPLPPKGQGIVLGTRFAFYSQPNRVPPGTYRMKVAVFSENAPEARASIEVYWSGRWEEDLEQMLQQFTVRAFSPAP